MQPKLLIINWQDIRNPHAGGAEVHLHESFGRLAKKGYDVTLLCSHFEGAAYEEIVDNIKVIRRGNRAMFNYYVPKFYYELSKEARRKGKAFDAVIDDINKIPFFTPLFVREKVLGIGHHFFGKAIYRETNPIAASYVLMGELLIAPVYKRTPFIVTSQSTKDEFVNRGFNAQNISIYANGIDHNICRVLNIPKRSNPTVAYFGRVKKYKSIDILIHAFALVKERITKAELIIIGGGDDIKRLKKIVSDLSLHDSVHFTGYVPTEEKIRLLNEVHVVVNPSLKEGFGLTNIEANACGTPTISSDVPGLRDSVINNQTGFLFPYGDVQSLANRLNNFFLDDDLRKNLSKGAAEYADRFTWDYGAETMEKFLLEYI